MHDPHPCNVVEQACKCRPHKHSIYRYIKSNFLGGVYRITFFDEKEHIVASLHSFIFALSLKRNLDDFNNRTAHLASARSIMSALDAPVIFQRPIESDIQHDYGLEAGAQARADTGDETVLDSTPEEQYFVIPEG